MAEIFISYKSERRRAAEHVAAVLERYDYSVWFDYRLIKGRDFGMQIDLKVREAKALIVLWCSRSVSSRWVAEEADLAQELGILIPVKIEPCELPVGFRRQDYIDLSEWDGAPRSHRFDQLLDALEQKIGRPPVPDFKALRDYETTWRRFGGLPLRDFAFDRPIETAEQDRGMPQRPSVREEGAAGRDGKKAGPARSELQASKDAKAKAARDRDAAEKAQRRAKERERAAALWASRRKVWAQLFLRNDFWRLGIVVTLSVVAVGGGLMYLRTPSPSVPAGTPGADRSARTPVAPAPTPPAPLRTFRDCSGCPEMVVVSAGTFVMGSVNGDADLKPVHDVTIPRPFAVGKYEVTFAEWDACAAAGGCTGNTHPDDLGWGRGRRPVITVSWNDAREYVTWLSRKSGVPYRLLTEAEREYAARAGTTTKYAFGDTITHQQAQFDEGKTAEAGSFPPNAWGLHDMHGNVWEWCEDNWHRDYLDNPPADGSAWAGGDESLRVLRGGSWNDNPRYLRSAIRSWNYPDFRSGNIGFRIARTL